ncbi:ARM repeat-containing protein [Artomyces pyxidatus]|uniref:ARM repeat-containing protein n=1 Tax=Artomyces pyxidatus TaxID=48021 RepID=A0ACB8TIA2_9AGAM|nr:ARM repeat-containing protein [Artomyces pyxidatus]
MADAQAREVFRELKQYCVPLLENSLLTPPTVPRVLSILTDLYDVLKELQTSGYKLSTSLVSYAVFPLTSILRRNASSSIPDRILELVLLSFGLLCESWWWDCDIKAWEQLFMLCGAVIGDLEGNGKGKERDDETKEAAVRCLLSLTRERRDDEDPALPQSTSSRADATLLKFTTHTQTQQFIPILGQALNSLINVAGSSHLSLQRASLQTLHVLLKSYIPEDFAPSVLPGVVSAMTRVSLGTSTSKGWANGDIVAEALSCLQLVVIKSVGDDVCLDAGAVWDVTDLDDLANLADERDEAQGSTSKAYHVRRTSTWLRATSSQLLIAMKTLTPLVSHPTPAALIGLSSLSSSILASTLLTLPSIQPLLVSFILSLSQTPYDSVSTHASNSLIQLMNPTSKVRPSILQTLLQATKDSLAAIPRLLPTHSDSKVEHVARQVEAICRFAALDAGQQSSTSGFTAIATGIGQLLGPMGGIEKWGWRLLSVLEFDSPSVTVTAASAAQLMLESGSGSSAIAQFPEMTLKHVATRSTQAALEQMLRALGTAGGEECLFSVEWFASVGRSRKNSNGVASIWCACRLLEGIAGIRLGAADVNTTVSHVRLRRAEKIARGLARSLAELWEDDSLPDEPLEEPLEDDTRIQHIKGLITLDETLRIGHHSATQVPRRASHPFLHTSVTLQLLAVTAGILQARFTPLLLHVLYPILHSIISPLSFLSETGFASLSFVTSSTSYASPANLLLSNFDYVLDAVSRRLSRQRLDIDAMKVLVVLVRLVGHDVVQKAGDVVEECFDRLDEYHGYEVIVDGLVEVLGEVVKVVEEDEDSHVVHEADPSAAFAIPPDGTRMDSFANWFSSRHKASVEEEDTTDYGPAPRRPWGDPDNTEKDSGGKADEGKDPDPNAEPAPTPTQALTKQIVSRSIYFLTHDSPLIRAKILTLLTSAVPVLPESALLSSVHQAWPFILNRLADKEPYVVTAAAGLIEELSLNVAPFMFRRIWDDIWPKFRKLLQQLDVADSKSALTRRGGGGVGTEPAYTQSHRLYRSILRTMTAAAKHVQVQDSSTWEMVLGFRRFLHRHAHEDLQARARELYLAIAAKNEDAVWLGLVSTTGEIGGAASFLKQDSWEIQENADRILNYTVS